MNLLRQAGWSVLTLIAFACLSLYLSASKPVLKLDNDALSSIPDTFVTNLTLTQFDSRGHITHYLQTKTVRHVPRNDTHYLTTPHIKIIQKNQAPWEINAKKATAIQAGQQITFHHNVIIRQKKEKSAQDTLVTTEEMTYFPQKQLASTRKPIRLSQAGNVVTSTGMNAYLADNRVQLLNNAQAVYEPNHG